MQTFAKEDQSVIIGMIEELAKNKETKFFDVPEKELFASGYANGITYTDKDIQAIVDNTNYLISNFDYKIPLKLGHDNDKTITDTFKTMLESDSMPAFGFVENIKKVGSKIVGDFKNIPEKLFNLIEKGMFPKKSAEIYLNYADNNGKNLGKALCAVALLGASQPAIPALNESNQDKETVIFNNIGDTDMTDELKRQLEAKDAELKTKDAELEAFKAKEAEASEKSKEAQTELESFKKAQKDKEINEKVDSLIKEQKIFPYQKEAVKVLLSKGNDSDVVKFSKDDTEQEMSVNDAITELFSNRPKIDFTKEYSNGEKAEDALTKDEKALLGKYTKEEIIAVRGLEPKTNED